MFGFKVLGCPLLRLSYPFDPEPVHSKSIGPCEYQKFGFKVLGFPRASRSIGLFQTTVFSYPFDPKPFQAKSIGPCGYQMFDAVALRETDPKEF